MLGQCWIYTVDHNDEGNKPVESDSNALHESNDWTHSWPGIMKSVICKNALVHKHKTLNQSQACRLYVAVYLDTLCWIDVLMASSRVCCRRCVPLRGSLLHSQQQS